MDKGAIAPRFDASDLSECRSKYVIGVVLTQYGINKGLKLFKQRGDDAVKAEMQQLHESQVMQPISADSLTDDERSRSLR